MKPILFNTEMVRAILDGKKTQFRLPIAEEFYYRLDEKTRELPYVEIYTIRFISENSKYKVDDILYVKETFALVNGGQYIFKADDNEKKYESVDLNIKWNSAVHLTQTEARIFLKVTNARVERLQDISVRDIEKESGWRREIYSYSNKNKAFLRDYCDFWNSTAKDGYKWEDNPYVFVYEFERVELSEVNK